VTGEQSWIALGYADNALCEALRAEIQPAGTETFGEWEKTFALFGLLFADPSRELVAFVRHSGAFEFGVCGVLWDALELGKICCGHAR
jgi:hypothetical protein